jgi:hypothetical protein
VKKHLLLAGLAIFSMASARAVPIIDYNALTTDFLWKYITRTSDGSPFLSVVASPGSLTIRLNDNGTMSAVLKAPDDLQWTAIALDSAGGGNDFGRIYDFSGNSHVTPSSFGTAMGTMATGLSCSPACSGSASWSFGSVGQFKSVSDVTNGWHAYIGNIGYSPTYLRTTTAQYLGTVAYVQTEEPPAPTAPSSIPEPASISLTGAGLMAIALLHRRSRRRA